MRWVAIAGSLVAHAGLAAAFVHADRARERPTFAPLPLEVRVLRAPAPPPALPKLPAVVPATPPRPRAATVDRSAPASPRPPAIPKREPVPTPAPTPPPPGKPWMAMRPNAGKTDVVIPPPQSYVPPSSPADNALPPGADLSREITVPVIPGPHGATNKPFGGEAEADGDGGYRKDHIAFSARINRDGSINFKDKPNVGFDGVNGIGFSMHFDLTDAVMRAMGDDPYAYEKMRFMEATREERMQMALADRTVRLHEAVSRMPAYLQKIWVHPKWTPVERRRIYFTLWDEVDEKGDDEVVQIGLEVRAAIMAFIRKKMPAGSAAAYTPAELEAFNRARHSRAHFAPYSPSLRSAPAGAAPRGTRR